MSENIPGTTGREITSRRFRLAYELGLVPVVLVDARCRRKETVR